MPFEAPEIVIRAIYPDPGSAEVAADDLRTRFGLDDDHLSIAGVPAGRYELEDGFDPERSHELLLVVALASLAGAALGIGLVAAAGGSALGFLAGAFGGSFFGAVIGAVIGGSLLIPDGADEDHYLDVSTPGSAAMVTARLRWGRVHQVHRALRRDGAQHFLRLGSIPGG